MELKRFFADMIEDGEAILSGEEFLHCVRVTRHKVGFTIVVCTGDGLDHYATIQTIGKDTLRAKIFKTETNEREIHGNLVHFQGMCKEFDFIAQKAVELGATRIVPFYSTNTAVTDIRRERLQKIILEAAKQCGRARLPVLGEALRFDEAIAQSLSEENRIFCYEKADGRTIQEAVTPNTKTLALFVGGEGGFTQDEADYAAAQGLRTVTLGKRILRAETAAVAALTLSLAALGEL